jgi:hypothetical protein
MVLKECTLMQFRRTLREAVLWEKDDENRVMGSHGDGIT